METRLPGWPWLGFVQVQDLIDLFDWLDHDKGGTGKHSEIQQVSQNTPIKSYQLLRLLTCIHESFSMQFIANVSAGGTITIDEFMTGFKWVNEPLRAKSLVKLQETGGVGGCGWYIFQIISIFSMGNQHGLKKRTPRNRQERLAGDLKLLESTVLLGNGDNKPNNSNGNVAEQLRSGTIKKRVDEVQRTVAMPLRKAGTFKTNSRLKQVFLKHIGCIFFNVFFRGLQ